MKCKLCDNKLKNDDIIFSVKDFPLGTFIKKEDIGKEILKNLNISYCDNCKLLQVNETIKGEKIFSNYFYKTHDIETMKNHFYQNATNFYKENKHKNVSVLEIGGNSCPFGEKLVKEYGLRNFTNFDPSNIALQYKPEGITLINDFFNENNVKKLLLNKKFDYIFTSNSFAHIEDIHSVLRGILLVSYENTELTIEVQSLQYLIEELCYPFFYHEHVYYYSEYSLLRLLERYGFFIKDLKIINFHGKSLQITFTKNKSNENIKLREKIISKKDDTFNYNIIYNFRNYINNQKRILIDFIKNNKNKKIAFYGASGQGNCFLTFNFSNMDVSNNYPLIDDTKIKEGLFTPKTHLKIYPREYLNEFKPDFIILLAYNFRKEIMEKNKNLKTKWIIPLPEFKIL